jgi:hypothetical protein
MMHSYTWETPTIEGVSGDKKKEVTFHYNSDLSGEVIIVISGVDVRVPAHAVLAFVAYCYVLRNKMSALEDKSWSELLNDK